MKQENKTYVLERQNYLQDCKWQNQIPSLLQNCIS